MAVEIVSGVGVRYCTIIPLDADGLPAVSVKQAAPMQGVQVEGVSGFPVTQPEPQRFSHRGDDFIFAQDSLPSSEAGSFSIVAAKTNLKLDALLSAVKLREVGNVQMLAGDTDKLGNEPLVGVFAYRQALDTDKSSPTLGKLRQWEAKAYMSARITPPNNSFAQATTENTYNATPSPSSKTLTGVTFTESVHGCTQATYEKMVFNAHPRWNWWLGNGTRVLFELSHVPVSDSPDDILVYVDGVLVTAFAAVNLTTPSFTLSAAPADNAKIIAVYGTNAPGRT
jgi:hypothetical protein